MQLLQENERNKVYREDEYVYKYFSNTIEYFRELSALSLLHNNKPDFVFPGIENSDKLKLYIKTRFLEFISWEKAAENGKVSFDNSEKLAYILLSVHQMPLGETKSINIQGVIDKALKEGLLLTNTLEIRIVKLIRDNYEEIISLCKKSRKECFIHGDVQPGNIIFNKEKKIVGLLDWGHAGAGLAEFDLRQLPCYFGKNGVCMWKIYEKNTKRILDRELLYWLVLCRFLELCFHYSQRVKEGKKYKILHLHLKYFLETKLDSGTIEMRLNNFNRV